MLKSEIAVLIFLFGQTILIVDYFAGPPRRPREVMEEIIDKEDTLRHADFKKPSVKE